MTDPNRPNEDPENAAQAEPVVSKPYVMPDDPEPGSVFFVEVRVCIGKIRHGLLECWCAARLA